MRIVWLYAQHAKEIKLYFLSCDIYIPQRCTARLGIVSSVIRNCHKPALRMASGDNLRTKQRLGTRNLLSFILYKETLYMY